MGLPLLRRQADRTVMGEHGLPRDPESQFAHEPNASKVGMAVLSWHLAQWGFRFFDGKLIGPLWASMGCREIPSPNSRMSRTHRKSAWRYSLGISPNGASASSTAS